MKRWTMELIKKALIIYDFIDIFPKELIHPHQIFYSLSFNHIKVLLLALRIFLDSEKICLIWQYQRSNSTVS